MSVPALAMALSTGAGASLGLLGGGGSILTVPILLYAAHMDTQQAIALSLLIVGTTSAAAAVPHARAGNVRGKAALAFGLASMLGAVFGSKISHYLPSSALLAAFIVMMLATGVAMLRKRTAAKAAARPAATARMALYGVAVGVLTGLVGAGGGFVIVPSLVLFGGMSIASAIGTSLVIIALNSLTAFVAHLGSVPVDWSIALPLAASSIAGSLGGAMLVGKVPPGSLRKGFAILVIAVAAVMAARQLVPGLA